MLFDHDARGRLIRERRPARDEVIERAMDAVGNVFRTASQRDRRYGAGGRLEEADGFRYEYDADGNQTAKIHPDDAIWRYAWDGHGMLREVERPDGSKVAFEYDAFARRTKKRLLSAAGEVLRETRYVWDGHVIVHELGGDEDELITWRFEPETFTPIAKEQGERRWAIASDHLGTPSEMVDELGKLAWKMQLDVLGVPAFEEGDAAHCPFRWPGQYEDEETGLYYNRFRYFEPKLGVYTSPDPIGLDSRNYNLFSHVADPTLWIDFLGLDWNYVLVDSTGSVYYTGRASDKASLADVARRHAANIGADGRARFGAGDTLRQITARGTIHDLVRGLEQVVIEERPLLGRGSSSVRGNLINGISDAKRLTEIGQLRLSLANSALSGQKATDLPSLAELGYEKCK